MVLVGVIGGSLWFTSGSGAQPVRPQLHLAHLPGVGATDDDLLQWSELVLSGQCMVHYGYSFYVDWTVDDSIPNFGAMPYGTDDMALARKYGYGFGVQQALGTSGAKADPNRSYVATLTTKQQQAYTITMFGTGVDKIEVKTASGVESTDRDGCLADARRFLYGDLDTWVPLDVWVNNLDVDIVPRVQATKSYIAALGMWRTCMTAQGQPAESPDASRQRIMKLYQTETYADAWPVEQTVAVADATCTAQSKLLTVAKATHAQIVGQLQKARAADVKDFLTRKTQAVDRARKLLSQLTHH